MSEKETTEGAHVEPGTEASAPPAPPRKLGKLPAKAGPNALHLARFAMPMKALPAATNFWPNRRSFPLRTFGNTTYGDCTRASQGNAAMRMERLEVHRTPKITDDEVIRVYKEMTTRRYGADWVNDPANADTGAYEEDALSDWRNPQYAMRDYKGRPLTIDAYVRVNQRDPVELKTAIATAGAHGVKCCFSLPRIWSGVEPPARWDVRTKPDGTTDLLGDAMPGSWGGHSMFARDYTPEGIWLTHTWGIPDQLVTWAGAAAYMDEAYMVIDSLDEWRKKPAVRKALDLEGIRAAVNAASDVKIA